MPHQQTQLNTLAFGLTQSRSACVRLRDFALAWVFSAALLLAQGVDLSHNHEGDLQAQFDCDICLVTGSLSDALSSAEIGVDFPRDTVSFDDGVTSQASYTAIRRQARAPPVS